MTDTIPEITTELNEAKRDLHFALRRIGHKAALGGFRLRPIRIIRHNPWTALCAALIVGLIVGELHMGLRRPPFDTKD